MGLRHDLSCKSQNFDVCLQNRFASFCHPYVYCAKLAVMAVENSRAMDPYPYDPIRGSLTVTNLVTSKHQTAQPDQGNQRQATCWNLGSLPIRQITGDHSIRFLQAGRDADITIIIHREKVTVLHHPGLFGHSFGFALGQDQFKSPFIVFIC